MFIATGDERSQHVQGHDDDHHLGAETVEGAHELAQGHIPHYVPDVAVSFLRRRRIEDHQKDAGNRFPHKHEGRKPAEAECGVDVGDFGVIEAGNDVEPETVGVGAQPRVGTAGLLAAQHVADVIHVEARRQALDCLIGLGDGGPL